ncbi:bifunctional 2-keto-4-hydroxyglutarate aldolase/2-keto-3-deoxy-6-phosphogluconate aldolase [Vagococcus acidifermentans]|uniref:Bifunctional 2-keto-4-hydroxyglutarate aldolase/2-keto-3-deoxy-6-phosphogluconate aldolase n=1 Tax=Vagococcus acidifermentans TaxID=564710 RepID=A0A430ALM7_9ENTE|nr:bifunctional 2-keto-4-hydroxyglutarate aldolase/2-keto-3-deoxy-6-phosphogluconate aldolase [Vagococcus acidifermentans]RSU09040.1 bifunctional 2-keto-4-hydroxyglutarate aldolase/2-keto-3-deoxy-6-phosphogluconate aldolase [Vagococcus acidifermentans]
MKRHDLMQKLGQEKLVAVIRGSNEEEVMQIVDAVQKGGIHLLEITFTIPRAQEIIAKLAEKYADDGEVVIGAGTVLDVTTARLAISAGAKFVVSPHFDKEIMKLCNSYGIPVFPGATTVKDMLECLRYGAEVIKLFPGDTFGPTAIKSFKGPLPQAEFMPTGGVSIDNLSDWLDNGAFAVGTGSSLTKGAKTGDFAQVTKEAARFVEAVRAYDKK